MNFNFTVLALSCGTLLFSTLSYAELIYKDVVDQQREKVIPLIKQGQVDTGLQKLRQLLGRYPNNQKLIADFVVMAYENKKFAESDIRYLKGIQSQQFPDYGKIYVIKALRDLKKFELAENWAKTFAKTDSNPQWIVWTGILQAEAGKKAQAKKTLSQVDINQVEADYLAQLSYTYRLLDMPVEALNTANLAIEKSKDVSTEEQYALALLTNADYANAENFIQNSQSLKENADLRANAKINEFSQRIQNAVEYYKLSIYRGRKQPYQPLDEVLADMEQYESQLPNDPNWKRRFYYEYIYALNERNRSKKVFEQIPKTGVPIEQMPPYVRQAIADAYFKNQQPQIAEKIYKNLLQEKNYAHFELYAGLYYSLIEQEKYKEADQLLKIMDKALPTFQYSNAKGVDKVTHDDRSEYLALVGLNYAYRQEYAKAEQYYEQLIAKAPNNVLFQNNRAFIQLLRENPQRAEWIVSQWDGVIPVDEGIRIRHLENLRALENIQQWRIQSAELMQTMPEDTTVVKNKKELNDRNHASIQHLSNFSESDSDNSALLDRLRGNREQDHFTRIHSPWLFDNYRTYVDHSFRSGEYDTGTIEDQRVGLGLEWASRRKAVNIMLSQSIDNEQDQDRFGVKLNWSQWLNDHWQYALGFNSQADIPLQAIRNGNEGKSYIFDLNWQQHESRKAGLVYQLTDIDDDNTRQELSAYLKQQIFQAPHHTTSLTLAGYYSQNKDVIVDYFNPEESYSAELNLQHEWITWRRYERNFTQHFEATIGTFGQDNYSSKPIYNVFYEHDWQLSRTWRLNYGIGWGTHPYDGEDEEKTYATVGFKGIF